MRFSGPLDRDWCVGKRHTSGPCETGVRRAIRASPHRVSNHGADENRDQADFEIREGDDALVNVCDRLYPARPGWDDGRRRFGEYSIELPFM